MTVSERLDKLERRLTGVVSRLTNPEFAEPLESLTDWANQLDKSWSGSSLGYQSRVYYRDLKPVPPGSHFSVEWGLQEVFSQGTVGEWGEYDRDYVLHYIRSNAGVEDTSEIEAAAERAKKTFEEVRTLTQSVLSKVEKQYKGDQFLKQKTTEMNEIRILSRNEISKQLVRSGQVVSRDMLALQGGQVLPPHREIIGEIIQWKLPFTACEHLAKVLKALSFHMEEDLVSAPEQAGTKIFIGHGHSPAWKDLRDFLRDRLKLQWDEFNRVPTAGVSTDARLSQMLSEASFAFLVMTAEDEQKEKALHPRLNVVHEAGLFQGRLGFKKAIILLEEGCEEFSNITGLGQIRFPKGKVSACFEEIRLVLEREGVILPP
jgi:hypothetical protein